MKRKHEKPIPKLACLLLCVLMVSSCSNKKNLVVLLPGPSGDTSQIVVENKGGTQRLSQSNLATTIASVDAAPAAPFPMREPDIQKTFGPALAVLPAPPAHFNLYFMAGTTELTAESSELMKTIVTSIGSSKPGAIVIAGHTDRVGAREKNHQLAFSRAEVIKQLFMDQGIGSSLVEITSHGEDNPLIVTDDEVPEPRNRRVEIVLY